MESKGRALARLSSLVVAFAAAGCGSIEFEPEEARRHVVSADADGAPIDPITREGLSCGGGAASFCDYVDRLLAEADAACDRRRPGKPRRLLLFVHGGLNTHAGAVERAVANARRVLGESDPGDWAYPLFFTWPSGGVDSYFDHLLLVRQAREAPWFGPITSPLVLATDLAEGLLHLPRTWLYQGAHDASHAQKVVTGSSWLPSWRNSRALADHALAHGDYDLALGDYERGFGTQFGRTVSYWATFP
ncbi:MAG: hypothetical protein ACF8XB_16190 [Planctomycetota bacterium JB042]